jgi:hypothetical protein
VGFRVGQAASERRTGRGSISTGTMTVIIGILSVIWELLD